MAKKRKINSKNESNILKYIAWFLATIALVMSSLVAGYYFGYEDAKEDITRLESKQKEKRLTLLKKIEQTNSSNVNNRLKTVLKKESEKEKKIAIKKKEPKKLPKYVGASHEYEVNSLAKPPLRAKREKIHRSSNKPKLAIIIDDVSVKSHVNAIKSLGIPLTMSFLPPTKNRPYSAKLAAKEKFYMVHLPMEAKNFNAEEDNTLRVTDSQQIISARIEEIKVLFPRVKYINNHTGSKFTSSEIAMNRLIFALNANNIRFIDSRTTATTKAPKVLKNFGLKYVARDVFLDHRMEKAYIKKQIKKVIRIAKAEGVAIAIGHPHSNTILALYESKELLKQVDLVYINKVY